ncbi:MAG: hypothetical protein P1U89_19855 [Verrucomicrobiales bacterium]|nr:hypothetical protein [Verrucomicrobiales bacterium]
MKKSTRLLIGSLMLAAVVLVLVFIQTGKTTVLPDDAVSNRLPQAPLELPSPSSEDEESQREKPAPEFDEDDVALPVEGNPLVVTLLYYPELGEISIEQYSHKAGGFTGKPMKSGTKVQIPDPNKKGERIEFIIP